MNEKEFNQKLADMGCIVCGAPAEIHHVTTFSGVGKRSEAAKWLKIPLCPGHHRLEKDAIHQCTKNEGLLLAEVVKKLAEWR